MTAAIARAHPRPRHAPENSTGEIARYHAPLDPDLEPKWLWPYTFNCHGPGAPYFGKRLVISIVLCLQSMSPIGLLNKTNLKNPQTRKSRQADPPTQTGVKTEGILPSPESTGGIPRP